MGWSEERIAELKKLWAEGHSASQIAKRLGHVTRNGVIGKVHRLGLSVRAIPSRPVRLPQKRNVQTRFMENTPKSSRIVVEPITKTASVVVFPQVVGNAAKAVTALKSNQCKWPIGDPSSEGFSFCGCEQEGKGPYCNDHRKVSSQPFGKRQYQVA